MDYGLWQIFITLIGMVFMIALIVGIVGGIITYLLTFVPKSNCNGDCEQGRRCTCEEKK
jgi:hypothetical protein